MERKSWEKSYQLICCFFRKCWLACKSLPVIRGAGTLLLQLYLCWLMEVMVFYRVLMVDYYPLTHLCLVLMLKTSKEHQKQSSFRPAEEVRFWYSILHYSRNQVRPILGEFWMPFSRASVSERCFDFRVIKHLILHRPLLPCWFLGLWHM